MGSASEQWPTCVICDWLHSGWGDRVAVHWPADPSTADFMECDGHLRGVCVGDEIRMRFESGRIGIFTVNEIRYGRDPSDMFFAKLAWKDYADVTVAECEERNRAYSAWFPERHFGLPVEAAGIEPAALITNVGLTQTEVLPKTVLARRVVVWKVTRPARRTWSCSSWLAKCLSNQR